MNRKQRRMEKSRGGTGKNEASPAVQKLFNEALAHQQAGRLAEAEQLYRTILAQDPAHTGAANNAGVVLQAQGRIGEALECYKRAVALNPDSAGAWFNVGNMLILLDRLEEAMDYFERAIEYKPDYADAHFQLGQILKKKGEFEKALKHFLRASALKPDANTYINTGIVLQETGRPEDAAAQYRSALALKPDSYEALNGLGVACESMGRLEEALAHHEHALAIRPDSVRTLNNMGAVFKSLGRLDEAMACYRRALAIDPAHGRIFSNLLMSMIYAPSVTPADLATAAREFGVRIADPLRRQRPFVNDRNSVRKLRIGYVSPDFRKHAVNYFFEPLLKLHDRAQFDIFAYSSNAVSDLVTDRLKVAFDHWRDIVPLDDDRAADLIEADGIDILVDLAGHTAKNRLMVFARKPAPVQVTWLGYPATTGMKAMDYRITDSCAEPEGMTEHLNVETLWRLPRMFCCYHIHEDGPDVIDHPPFEDNGTITFGCFNNFARVSDPALKAWSRILALVPESRLLLEISGVDGPQFRSEVEERLRRLGLPPDRVILEPRRASNQFVLYNRIDIALDPFPGAGGTTSMDTLWMGVPFVTLAGDSFLSRLGVTILTNAGLPELIAGHVDEYVDLASSLALDKVRLRNLRHRLRDRVAVSPAMDRKVFARNMEAAYREMWRKWCDER